MMYSRRMKKEICAAVEFLSNIILKNVPASDLQRDMFQRSLIMLLRDKYEGHWFPEKPDKGQGYRCIRLNGRNVPDELLRQAAILSGIKYESLKVPLELTVWIDPYEVCYRFGERRGSCNTFASFTDEDRESPNREAPPPRSEEANQASNNCGEMFNRVSWTPPPIYFQNHGSFNEALPSPPTSMPTARPIHTQSSFSMPHVVPTYGYYMPVQRMPVSGRFVPISPPPLEAVSATGVALLGYGVPMKPIYIQRSNTVPGYSRMYYQGIPLPANNGFINFNTASPPRPIVGDNGLTNA